MDKSKNNKEINTQNNNKGITIPKVNLKTEPTKVVKKVSKGLCKMGKPILYSSMGMVGVASGLTAGVSAAICVAGTIGVVGIVAGIDIIIEHKKCKKRNELFK